MPLCWSWCAASVPWKQEVMTMDLKMWPRKKSLMWLDTGFGSSAPSWQKRVCVEFRIFGFFLLIDRGKVLDVGRTHPTRSKNGENFSCWRLHCTQRTNKFLIQQIPLLSKPFFAIVQKTFKQEAFLIYLTPHPKILVYPSSKWPLSFAKDKLWPRFLQI